MPTIALDLEDWEPLRRTVNKLRKNTYFVQAAEHVPGQDESAIREHAFLIDHVGIPRLSAEQVWDSRQRYESFPLCNRPNKCIPRIVNRDRQVIAAPASFKRTFR